MKYYLYDESGSKGPKYRQWNLPFDRGREYIVDYETSSPVYGRCIHFGAVDETGNRTVRRLNSLPENVSRIIYQGP